MLGLVALVAFAASASVIAANQNIEYRKHHTECVDTHAASQGKHCNGTVGCDCKGFAPITNGKEWEKSYCKHCGHHQNCHR